MARSSLENPLAGFLLFVGSIISIDRNASDASQAELSLEHRDALDTSHLPWLHLYYPTSFGDSDLERVAIRSLYSSTR